MRPSKGTNAIRAAVDREPQNIDQYAPHWARNIRFMTSGTGRGNELGRKTAGVTRGPWPCGKGERTQAWMEI